MYAFRFVPSENKSTENIMNLLKVSSAPVIPTPEEIIDKTTLGDSTIMHYHTGVYEDREIEIECNFVGNNKKQWLGNFTKIQKYFAQGEGTLQLMSDDQEHYWKVKKTECKVKSRFAGRDSEFNITFTVDPYRYLLQYARPYNIVSNKTVEFYNSYELSYPTYVIYNTSTNATEITIKNNGYGITITNPFAIKDSMKDTSPVEHIEINTEQMYMMIVYENGASDYTTLRTQGSFEDIQLNKGANNVIVTCDVGEVSCDVYRNYREL